MERAAAEWKELVRREPALAVLRADVAAVRDPGGETSFCANARWFGYAGAPGFKQRVAGLVGWGARRDDPLLRSLEAYECAYETLYGLLPPCRSCSC